MRTSPIGEVRFEGAPPACGERTAPKSARTSIVAALRTTAISVRRLTGWDNIAQAVRHHARDPLSRTNPHLPADLLKHVLAGAWGRPRPIDRTVSPKSPRSYGLSFTVPFGGLYLRYTWGVRGLGPLTRSDFGPCGRAQDLTAKLTECSQLTRPEGMEEPSQAAAGRKRGRQLLVSEVSLLFDVTPNR